MANTKPVMHAINSERCNCNERFHLLLRGGMMSFVLFALVMLPNLSSYGQGEQKVPPVPDAYSIANGHLHIKPYQHLFFELQMDEVRTDTIFIYNHWGSSMQLTFPNLPPFLSITPVPALLPPHTKGSLLVTYNAKKRNDFEMVTDQVTLLTNDTLNPAKRLPFIAVIVEDFSSLTLRQLRNAPVATLSTESYDFGTIQQGAIVTYSLELKNMGKEDLVIRKIKTTCGCTAGSPDKTLIEPGGSADIRVAFNTFGREGKHQHTVTLITNDPENTYLFFHIGGEIVPEQ